MPCVCTICNGKGYTIEQTERGTTLTDRCWSCGGDRGWDEGEAPPARFYGKPLVDAAERRRLAE